MKVKILISGQLNGNFELKRYLNNGEAQKTNFGGFVIPYDSMKVAKQAIKYAYKQLKQNNNSCLSKSLNNCELSYDASKAIIYKSNNNE